MMRLYCWGCKQETDHLPKNEEFATCQICDISIWIDEYPIGDDAMPNSSSVAYRQRYQREKHAYYKALGREDPYYQES